MFSTVEAYCRTPHWSTRFAPGNAKLSELPQPKRFEAVRRTSARTAGERRWCRSFNTGPFCSFSGQGRLEKHSERPTKVHLCKRCDAMWSQPLCRHTECGVCRYASAKELQCGGMPPFSCCCLCRGMPLYRHIESPPVYRQRGTLKLFSFAGHSDASFLRQTVPQVHAMASRKSPKLIFPRTACFAPEQNLVRSVEA